MMCDDPIDIPPDGDPADLVRQPAGREAADIVGSSFPRVEVIFGVPVCLLEPVHPDYYPGRAAFTHDWPIPDPSNAPAGMPARSPHGFPLWYPLDPAGAACGAPRVTWGGLMFANDEDVERTIRKAIGAGGFGPVGRFRRPDGRM